MSAGAGIIHANSFRPHDVFRDYFFSSVFYINFNSENILPVHFFVYSERHAQLPRAGSEIAQSVGLAELFHYFNSIHRLHGPD